jgi:hypothetical protein
MDKLKKPNPEDYSPSASVECYASYILASEYYERACKERYREALEKIATALTL